jgi:hypothetical protein
MRVLVIMITAFFCVAAATAADEPLRPPDLSLRSFAGAQAGVQGSYCVRDSTQGVCGDTTQPLANVVSIVRPGGRLALRPSEGSLTSVSVSLGALRCNGTWRSLRVRLRNGVWQFSAPKRPGAYGLFVFARFTTEQTSGDTSAGFGLLVSRNKPRRIVPAGPYAVC